MNPVFPYSPLSRESSCNQEQHVAVGHSHELQLQQAVLEGEQDDDRVALCVQNRVITTNILMS